MNASEPNAHHPSPATDGRKCYLCGGNKFTIRHAWEPGELRNSATIPVAVWDCECGIVMLHPVPTAQQLPEAGDWWGENRARVFRRPQLKKVRRKLSRWFVGSPIQRLVRSTRKAVPTGRLLDVGCGVGKLLQEAAPFYQCVGLDPSPKAAEVVRAAGFEVIIGIIEEAEIAPASFNVVMMQSVIEHVMDPLRVMQIVHRILAPGGVVAVLTPKLGGPAYRMHGKGWNGFRVGYHTYLFTGQTLGRTLEQAGFEVLKSPKRDRALDDCLILWGRKPA